MIPNYTISQLNDLKHIILHLEMYLIYLTSFKLSKCLVGKTSNPNMQQLPKH